MLTSPFFIDTHHDKSKDIDKNEIDCNSQMISSPIQNVKSHPPLQRMAVKELTYLVELLQQLLIEQMLFHQQQQGQQAFCDLLRYQQALSHTLNGCKKDR